MLATPYGAGMPLTAALREEDTNDRSFFELYFRALFEFIFALFLDETIPQLAEHLLLNLKH